MRRRIRLSETDLHRVIKESVKRVLSEGEAWANQPPIDEFHPDWWYYRQEVEPEGLEDFDPCMDLSDEEYDEHLRQKFGESKLRRVVKETVKRVLRENEEYGLFDIFISNTNRPDIAYVNNNFYEIPKGQGMDLQTRDGRRAFIDAINNGNYEMIDIQSNGFKSPDEFYSWLKPHGYRQRSYNANAW